MINTHFSNLFITTKKLTLLYIENHDETIHENLKLFHTYFNKIIIAKNGQEGIDKFKTHDIHIIITEINLPQVNGIELLTQIKNLDKDIITIILS